MPRGRGRGGGRGRGRGRAGGDDDEDDYQPCASCKYQRRHCGPHCRYAKYFPLSRYPEYAAAHRLLGLNNINKILTSVELDQRMDAANSIMTEGNLWLLDPECGPMGVTRRLKEGIDRTKRELDAVNQQLEYYRRARNRDDLHLTELTLKVPQANPDKGKDIVKPFDVDQMVGLEGNHSAANGSTSKLGESSSGKKPMEWDLNEPIDQVGSSSDDVNPNI